MPETTDPLKISPWNTIDDILSEMDGVVQWTIERGSRSGYFAALYRKVTLAVKKAIAASYFDDGSRMERLDVVFAARYLEAFRDYHQGKHVSLSWKAAFDGAKAWRPIVLQHLLLGMNAHINLDLAAAAVLCAPGDKLQDMKGDFYKINEILITLMEEVQSSLAKIWWSYKLVDRMTVKAAESLARFSMIRARNNAWETALRLAYLNPARLQEEMGIMDKKISGLSKLILNPGVTANAANMTVRLGERGSVSQIIMTLS